MDLTQGFLDFFLELFGEAGKFFTGSLTVLSIIIGTIQNVTGAVNQLLVNIIDWIAEFWPSTPDNLKLANIINAATADTGIGSAIVYETFQTIFLLLAVVALVKLYKLIPFKAS